MSEAKTPIVVGYDASSGSQDAVDWAAAEAARSRRPLTVLFAWGLADIPEAELKNGHARIEGAADGIATSGKERAQRIASGIEVRSRTSRESAATALLAMSSQAALIVVGDRHQQRATGLTGSVVLDVAAHADCPVVFVPASSGVTPGPKHPVVVGVDASTGSDAALQWGADFAARARAELVLAGAWHPPAAGHWTQDYLGDQDWRHLQVQGARHEATDHVAHARGVVGRDHPDLRFREHLEEAPASAMLARLSTDAALLVIGARGAGDQSPLMLGSVGRGVMNRAYCPVAFVR